jgi:hypothetical protein
MLEFFTPFMGIIASENIIYEFTSFTFTSGGQIGQDGPSYATLISSYDTITYPWLESSNYAVVNGVQRWIVPESSRYRIKTIGASGGEHLYANATDLNADGRGGLASILETEIDLTAGDVINILVGQRGGNTTDASISANNAGPGGGGGTFVYFDVNDTNPIIVSGGGAGSSNHSYLLRHANTLTSGNTAEGQTNGGTSGNGGLPNTSGSAYWTAGGAGWFTDGTGGNQATANLATAGIQGASGGLAPRNGGTGGTRYDDGIDEGGDGGFGGGGGGGSDNTGTAGGGGYSGGGGANNTPTNASGGGGGSYSLSTIYKAELSPVTFESNGSVTIRKIDSTYGRLITATDISQSGLYSGIINAPNGNLYIIPNSTGANHVIILDPETDAIDRSTIPVSVVVGAWAWAVLAPGGIIYAIPDISDNVLIIDTNTNTADQSSITGLGTPSYRGGVLAPNGKIYCIPYNATNIGIIDPETNTIDQSTITSGTYAILSNSNKWTNGVLAPNGKIYCPPHDETSILIIDPDTNTIDTSVSVPAGSGKCDGEVILAPNGKIYCCPRNATYVLIIDPTTDTVDTSTISGLSVATNKWIGSVLGKDGKIYFIPFNQTVVLIVDPSDDSFTTATITGITGGPYLGGGLADNGFIYGANYTGNNILKLTP